MASVRRLTAILAADVAGYSRLMGADEDGTHERLKAHFGELVNPKIKEHRGRVVKNTGDGLLAEFPSVVDGVRCAAEVQRGMVDREPGVPEERRIRFRIGVNLGDVIAEGGDVFGDGVNIAARLETLAEPGGICISRVVRDQIRDKLPYQLEDMGEQRVKNIVRPVRVYAMSAAAVTMTPLIAAPPPLGRARSLRRLSIPVSVAALLCIALVAWWFWPKGNPLTAQVQPATAASPKILPSVASTPVPRLSFIVLPFENLSRDPDQDYFADAITEDLTTDLSRIDGSFVIARNTAFSYKGKPVDVKQIGRDLGVRYVLEGSVRRLGGQIQVNVQLIDAENGTHLWADRFEADLRDLAQAQSEITGRLARTLNRHLIAAAAQRLEEEKRLDPDAKDLVLRGRASFQRPFSITSRQEGLQAFERALAIDPSSVGARIGIAAVLTFNILDGWSTSPQQDEVRAEQLLTEALERDAGSPWAHLVAGELRRAQKRLPEAKIELEEAIALDRNFAGAFSQLAITLNLLGQPEAAIPLQEKALRLDPQSSDNHVYNWALGFSHLLLGHDGEAVDLFKKARAANPRLAYIHLSLAVALGLKGDIDEARASLAEAIRIKPAWDTMAHFLADCTYCNFDSPPYRALAEKTLFVGLRRAGLPDE
jgi:adenylate cyclase